MKAGELGDFRLTCIATSVGISLPHTIGAVYSSGKLPLLPSNSPYNQPVESSEHMEVSITCYYLLTFVQSLPFPQCDNGSSWKTEKGGLLSEVVV